MIEKNVKLTAPSSLPIVGIRLADGRACSFVFSRDKIKNIGCYTVEDRGSVPYLEREGDKVLVDSAGKEWPALDVEFHSLASK